MENSNLSLRKWLMAITFISATKQGFTALELKRQMGFSRYQTVLDLYHKIRVIMGKRDDEYTLEDIVEYDEAFVTKVTAVIRKQISAEEEEASRKQLWLLWQNQRFWKILKQEN